jgi:hydrogenase expression/formation protein HypD
MNIENIFSSSEAVKAIKEAIHRESASSGREYRLMEVCGTHTMSIARHGIKGILPENIKLVSGPGCPVCVSSQADLDNCIELAGRENVAITTFGDMLKVVSSDGDSLSLARSRGADVRILYSPLDTIAMAQKEPDKNFIFIAVGFETTTPMAAGLVKTAQAKGLENISIFSMCKRMPPALDLLIADPKARIDGFLCPGNVTVVSGTSIYEPLTAAGRAAVVTGFEPVDILSSVLESVRQINAGKFHVVNNYKRAAKDEGNPRARALTDEVFCQVPARWRGLGILEESGLAVRPEYALYDAVKVYGLDPLREEKPTACRCGDVLLGYTSPKGCPLFAKACTPESAVGPCMVSSEGACAAYYKYYRDFPV